MLRACATKMSTKCEQYLPILEFDYNSSTHTSTRFILFCWWQIYVSSTQDLIEHACILNDMVRWCLPWKSQQSCRKREEFDSTCEGQLKTIFDWNMEKQIVNKKYKNTWASLNSKSKTSVELE